MRMAHSLYKRIGVVEEVRWVFIIIMHLPKGRDMCLEEESPCNGCVSLQQIHNGEFKVRLTPLSFKQFFLRASFPPSFGVISLGVLAFKFM
jgi:hypothetical protein